MRTLPDLEHDFVDMPLEFLEGTYENVFSTKNNKTVAETLQHPRYRSLESDFLKSHADLLDVPLGKAVLQLKNTDNFMYLRFLNRYGDRMYSVFKLSDKKQWPLTGVYTYYYREKLVYIGRCKDSMRKRIDQGYGKIYPKNCYIDGQATNCHLNALVTRARPDVTLKIHVIEEPEMIKYVERELIRENKTEWNIQGV